MSKSTLPPLPAGLRTSGMYSGPAIAESARFRPWMMFLAFMEGMIFAGLVFTAEGMLRIAGVGLLGALMVSGLVSFGWQERVAGRWRTLGAQFPVLLVLMSVLALLAGIPLLFLLLAATADWSEFSAEAAAYLGIAVFSLALVVIVAQKVGISSSILRISSIPTVLNGQGHNVNILPDDTSGLRDFPRGPRTGS